MGAKAIITILALFFLAVEGVVEAEWIGCFTDSSTIGLDLFTSDETVFHDSLTPDKKCLKYCESKGFNYFGLKSGIECFCSSDTDTPNDEKKTASEECDTICSGDETQNCGGTNRLMVYVIRSTQSNYVGCYKENSIAARLMRGAKKNFDSMTPSTCTSYCQDKGFKYAGIQYGIECFCSHERPSFKSSADETDCGTDCPGDYNQKCGGNYRLNVYETSASEVNHVRNAYLGCYSDSQSPSNRLLGLKKRNFNNLTPELCVGYCYRTGYRFAGVQYGEECFCGNYVDQNRRTSESACNTECSGSSNMVCGGSLYISVYSTDISDEPEDDKLLGCFEDRNDVRLLSSLSFTFSETNTPRLCLNVCLRLGFKYSGVENGSECFCGNKAPARENEKNEIDCLTPCPGDKIKLCGGSWRLLIYKTSDLSTSSHGRPTRVTQGGPIIRPPTTSTTDSYSFNERLTTTRRFHTSQSYTHATTTTTRRPSSWQGNSINARPTQKRPSSAVTTLSAVETMDNQKPSKSCLASVTEINGGKSTCRGEILFKDTFTRPLNKQKWAAEKIMPWIPDYEFVVFDDNEKNCAVKNSRLIIRPTPQDDEFVRKGRVDLASCTGTMYLEECQRQAASFSILPPIKSCRVTLKESLTFKYGTVTVRARLPQGDWILPEIWLEPKRRVYGRSYASGRIRIAMARGNKNLMIGEKNIGNRQLESGVLMGVGENVRGRTIIRDKPDGWHKNFHNYTLIWKPDNIQFLVDGDYVESVVAQGKPLSDIVGFDDSTGVTWKPGSKIAPFDQEFYLSLGVAVGGMREFPDDCISSGHEKPWKNMGVKALVNFWQDKTYWASTWNSEESAMQVESVTITAL